jgi:hypothetical protein
MYRKRYHPREQCLSTVSVAVRDRSARNRTVHGRLGFEGDNQAAPVDSYGNVSSASTYRTQRSRMRVSMDLAERRTRISVGRWSCEIEDPLNEEERGMDGERTDYSHRWRVEQWTLCDRSQRVASRDAREKIDLGTSDVQSIHRCPVAPVCNLETMSVDCPVRRSTRGRDNREIHAVPLFRCFCRCFSRYYRWNVRVMS